MSWEQLKECLIWAIKQLKEADEEDKHGRTAEYWHGYLSALEMVAFNSHPQQYHAWVMTNLSQEKVYN